MKWGGRHSTGEIESTQEVGTTENHMQREKADEDGEGEEQGTEEDISKDRRQGWALG